MDSKINDKRPECTTPNKKEITMHGDLVTVNMSLEIDQQPLKMALKSQLEEILRLSKQLDDTTVILQNRINELEDRLNTHNDVIARFKEETLSNERSLFQKILDIFPKNTKEKRLKETTVKV